MGGPTEMAQGRTREQVVSIIEREQVEVPVGMFNGGRGFGVGLFGIVAGNVERWMLPTASSGPNEELPIRRSGLSSLVSVQRFIDKS